MQGAPIWVEPNIGIQPRNDRNILLFCFRAVENFFETHSDARNILFRRAAAAGAFSNGASNNQTPSAARFKLQDGDFFHFTGSTYAALCQRKRGGR
jgi:hypothetical protein